MATNEQLLEQLNILRNSKTVIVGIGNTLKGDDGVGPLVCRRLSEAGICADLIDAGTVPENYIQKIIKKAPTNLVVVDAIDFGAAAGMIKIFEPDQLDSVVISTHTLSPRVFIDMIYRFIEVDVYFIGVQPEQTELGQAICEEVRAAVERLVFVFTQLLRRY